MCTTRKSAGTSPSAEDRKTLNIQYLLEFTAATQHFVHEVKCLKCKTKKEKAAFLNMAARPRLYLRRRDFYSLIPVFFSPIPRLLSGAAPPPCLSASRAQLEECRRGAANRERAITDALQTGRGGKEKSLAFRVIFSQAQGLVCRLEEE